MSDTLRVTTQAGMVLEFEVTSLGEGLLGGLGTSIPLQDIRTLEKRELSVLRTHWGSVRQRPAGVRDRDDDGVLV